MIAEIPKLFTPLKYLRIKHAGKKLFDWILPATIAAALTCTHILIPEKTPLTSEGGILDSVTGLLQILSGFYIAALAAVATFDRDIMDRLMPGVPPTIREIRHSKRQDVPLSMRRFLCYLLGYLAYMSIALYLAGSLAPLMKQYCSDITNAKLALGLKHVVQFIYAFFVIQLLTCTILALYFLSDRIHRD